VQAQHSQTAGVDLATFPNCRVRLGYHLVLNWIKSSGEGHSQIVRAQSQIVELDNLVLGLAVNHNASDWISSVGFLSASNSHHYHVKILKNSNWEDMAEWQVAARSV
jgi:hypothetical protein